MGSCFSQDTQQQLHSIDMKSWKLPENLSLSTHHISRLFELFRFMDIDQDGLICCKDILRFTNLPITILNERLFLLVDNNYKRNISFPDFVMGLCRLCTIDDMGMAKVKVIYEFSKNTHKSCSLNKTRSFSNHPH